MESILGLCRASLGWKASDPNEAFFNWKHVDNAFGESPSWVATTGDGDIVGLRVFMRWEFCGPEGRTYRAVRAVDTATHPDFQGRGIFTKLTLAGVEELTADGVDLVFNTPNDKSMPGYLKMGWSQVGSVPVGFRVGGIGSLIRTAKARTAAELWSEPATAGIAAMEFFVRSEVVDRLASTAPASTTPANGSAFTTNRSVEFYRWRYSFEPLRYRVWPFGDGGIVFRVRRRGAALEATICDVIEPDVPNAKLLREFGRLRKATGADYLLGTQASVRRSWGFAPLPGLGPMLTWRPLARPGVPTLAEVDLVLGDLELF